MIVREDEAVTSLRLSETLTQFENFDEFTRGLARRKNRAPDLTVMKVGTQEKTHEVTLGSYLS